ncbi:MAG: hypothetical protein PVF73_05580 [Bacteroidales bacterium]|jgi:hypothetical protein
MNIESLKEITKKPQLYQKGNSFMWTDPHISRQLLELHINPDTDIASRSMNKIRTIVKWISDRIDQPETVTKTTPGFVKTTAYNE